MLRQIQHCFSYECIIDTNVLHSLFQLLEKARFFINKLLLGTECEEDTHGALRVAATSLITPSIDGSTGNGGCSLLPATNNTMDFFPFFHLSLVVSLTQFVSKYDFSLC